MAETARIRVISDGATVATGVVERDKFVESLERLVARHGPLLGGEWSVLAQANTPSDRSPYPVEGKTMFDILESGGEKLVGLLGQFTSAGATGLNITPLAIYRTITA